MAISEMAITIILLLTDKVLKVLILFDMILYKVLVSIVLFFDGTSIN